MIPWPPSKSRGRRNEGKNLQYPDLALLDVREAWEAERGKIEGSQLADNALDQEIVTTWPRDREIVVYCEHGNRSIRATRMAARGSQRPFPAAELLASVQLEYTLA